MTNRDKNLIKFFLELSGLNKNTFKKEERILKELVYLTNYLPQDKKNQANKLQEDILCIFELLKWEYMDYGAKLNEVIENFNLDWIPETIEKISKEEIA